MSMEFLEGLIVPVIMAICICLGFIIKNFDKIPNKWIPVILAVVGILIALWQSWGAITPTTIAGGLASGLAACGAYDTYKHFFEDRVGIKYDNDETLTEEVKEGDSDVVD